MTKISIFFRATPVFALAMLGLRRDKQDALFSEQITVNRKNVFYLRLVT